MRSYKYKCDLCGREHESALRVKLGINQQDLTISDPYYEDLCRECVEAIKQFLEKLKYG